jgi:hypothetical protein
VLINYFHPRHQYFSPLIILIVYIKEIFFIYILTLSYCLGHFRSLLTTLRCWSDQIFLYIKKYPGVFDVFFSRKNQDGNFLNIKIITY